MLYIEKTEAHHVSYLNIPNPMLAAGKSYLEIKKQ
jgi:hypothetical protein